MRPSAPAGSRVEVTGATLSGCDTNKNRGTTPKEGGSPVECDQLLHRDSHVHVLVNRTRNLVGASRWEHHVQRRVSWIDGDARIREL